MTERKKYILILSSLAILLISIGYLIAKNTHNDIHIANEIKDTSYIESIEEEEISLQENSSLPNEPIITPRIAIELKNIVNTCFTSINLSASLGNVIPNDILVNDLTIKANSVSSLEIKWNADENREYKITWTTEAPYADNITLIPIKNGLYYLTGLRVNETYNITIIPIAIENEINANYISITKAIKTPNVPQIIKEFEYVDGWTSCFAGERASGLTAMPSSGAIYGSKVDTITNTGIRRFENGDYCVAMGTHYGYCNDRFLIELENGIQFTVRICDSKGIASVQDDKGLGIWHWFGGEGNGKCIIEMIYDDYNLPNKVAQSGSWGYYNWNGLNLNSNIKSIKKLSGFENT